MGKTLSRVSRPNMLVEQATVRGGARMLTVGVVIPAYNPRPEHLEQAIRSVVSQTYAGWDCVVVDDGSDVPVVADGVKVVRQSNRGVSAARNAGVLEVHGDLVAFLDQDDYWAPEKLARQIAFMDANDLVMSDTDFEIMRDGKIVGGGYQDHFGSFERLLSTARIGLSTMVVRRSVLVGVGGFSSLFTHVQDWELALRIAARGWPFRRLNERLATYRLHADNATKDYWHTHREQVAILDLYGRLFPDLRGATTTGRRAIARVGAFQAIDAFRAERDPRHLIRSLRASPAVLVRQLTEKVRMEAGRLGRP